MTTPVKPNMSIWTEHRNPEGRTYWFNTGTRESVWEKPEDLKSPFERAMNQTTWKEYFSGGRKYYYNTETKESKWEMPDELQALMDRVGKDPVPTPAAAPAFTPGENVLLTLGNTEIPTPSGDLSIGAHTGGASSGLPFTSTSILPARPNLPDDPVIPHNGFQTFEEGEKAFMHLLRKAGVDAGWTWDMTMRAIITDPLYKALSTLAEKKAAWQKFTDNLKAKEQEEREARLSKLRPALRNMLKGNPSVFHYTTFATANKLFSQHPIWQQAKIESERKLIFEDYVAELMQREMQETRAARSRSTAKVVTLFKELGVDVLTRWRKAHELIVESEQWQNDAELRKLPTLDILLAFEDYSRVREREFDEQMRRSQVEKTRKERKAREGFKELLQQLVQDGKIKARTKWKQVYPSFSNDDRYLGMLGNPGSNPIELFWDVVDNLDQKFDAKLTAVNEIIRKHNAKLQPEGGDEAMKVDEGSVRPFAVGPDTAEEEFIAIMKSEPNDAAKLRDEDLHEVFLNLHELAVKKQADEKRRAERKQRHLQDDLRYALKKLPDPLDITMPYEDVVPLIEHLPEYKAVADEDGRRAAFSKFVKRQRERLREVASEDGGSATSRKRKEPVREHEKEKDRERERERESHRDRGKEYEKESRTSKQYHRGGHDADVGHGHRSSHRDYGKERDKDYMRDEKDREYGSRPSKHHERDDGRKREREKEREKRGSGAHGGREWDDLPRGDATERGVPARGEDRHYEDRAEKRARYEEPVEGGRDLPPREDTPEEGEI